MAFTRPLSLADREWTETPVLPAWGGSSSKCFISLRDQMAFVHLSIDALQLPIIDLEEPVAVIPQWATPYSLPEIGALAVGSYDWYRGGGTSTLFVTNGLIQFSASQSNHVVPGNDARFMNPGKAAMFATFNYRTGA